MYSRERQCSSHYYYVRYAYKPFMIDALVIAIGIMINKSIYRNCEDEKPLNIEQIDPSNVRTWKSPSEDANEYSSVMVVNCSSLAQPLKFHISHSPVSVSTAPYNTIRILSINDQCFNYSHILETTKARDERRPTLPNNLNHATNILRMACKRRRNRSFCFGQ